MEQQSTLLSHLRNQGNVVDQDDAAKADTLHDPGVGRIFASQDLKDADKQEPNTWKLVGNQ